ncbi:SGNH/GDSL hydrolase family protein [Kiritimatiellaeota bacterium B1221]|nr:SGNH/GDSL hydrolase family protein [Kiritimatiellaeota bacterium B1221]
MKTLLNESFVHGAISLEQGENWVRPWRMNFADKVLFEESHGELILKMGDPAGIRVSFHTDSPYVELEVANPNETDTSRLYDLVADGEYISSATVNLENNRVRFDPLPEDASKRLEIWLPMAGKIQLKSLITAEGSSLSPLEDTRLRWVTYGSSITQCNASFSPSRTWPATAARAKDLQLTCLGFGGQCHIDSMIGRQIRDIPADIITLKLGINVYGRGSLNERSFAPAIVGMVQTIREKHPTTPIGLVTAIHGCNRETEKNISGMTLESYREQLRRAYQALKAHGDPHIFLFEGTGLLDKSLAHLLPDDLHPNGEGYEHMGNQVAEHLLPQLLADLKSS